MLTTTKNITLNGRSEFDVDGERKIAVAMTAFIGENGSFSKNENIIDISLYELNKEVIQNDISEFNNVVDTIYSEMSSK